MARKNTRELRKQEETARLRSAFGDSFFFEEKMKRFDTDDGEPIGNFSSVLSSAKHIEDMSYDYVSEIKNIEIVQNIENEDDNDKGMIVLKVKVTDNTHRIMRLSKWGLESLCVALGISSGYIKKCIQTGAYQLAADNINHWLRCRPENQSTLLRATFLNPSETNSAQDDIAPDSVLHGFLSSRYSILDDNEVFQHLNDTLKNDGKFVVKNSLVSETLSRIRIVSRETFETKNGDKLSYGFDVQNSRTGRSSLKFTFLLFRWACSNGMLFGAGKGTYYMQRHIGISREDFSSDLNKFIADIPDLLGYAKSIVQNAEDKVAAVSDVQSIIDQFLAMKTPEDAVEDFNVKLLEAFNSSETVCYWDIANIMTAIAKKKDILVRERLESSAARFLERNVKTR